VTQPFHKIDDKAGHADRVDKSGSDGPISRRAEYAEATRQAIVAAACRLFHEQGTRAMSAVVNPAAASRE
jgi:aspartate aminotransferase-like enzyme